MTKLIKNQWLWVGTFWTCTLFFGVWNHHAVDAILTLQSQNQVLRSELTFQQQNARKLERIQDEHSKLFLSAESVQLGVLSAKSLLTELASKFELTMGQMTVAPPQKGSETVILNLAFSGALERIIHFLATLDAYRYLQHQHLVIKLDPKSGDGGCELSLLLRCRIQPVELNESPANEPKGHSAL